MDPRVHIPKEKRSPQGVYQVRVPVAPVHRAPRPSSPRDSELLFGELFEVHQIRRGWAWGQALSPVIGAMEPGYVGYVRESQLSKKPQLATHQVTALSAPVFTKPDIKSRILVQLPLNALLSGEMSAGFLQCDKGFVHQRHVRETGKSMDPDFVSVAERLIGQPYIWGGISAFGLDCSGLVLTALRATGREAPRDSDMQADLGQAIENKIDLRRGDLVFWKGHVGIMQSATQLLHANAYHMAVASEPLSDAIIRIEKSAGPVTAMRRT